MQPALTANALVLHAPGRTAPAVDRLLLDESAVRESDRRLGRQGAHRKVSGATVVSLLPARTDTAWWQDHVMKAQRSAYSRGGSRSSRRVPAPFPSAVAIFGRKRRTGRRALSGGTGKRIEATEAKSRLRVAYETDLAEYPMTVREAARFLGVSPQTVYLWVERRQIPHLRVMGRNIRFLKSDLEPFRASFKQEVENGKTT